MRTYVLRVRAADVDIFNAIRLGKKPVETRAFTVRYKNAAAGDRLRFMCQGKQFVRDIKRVRVVKSPKALLKYYRVQDIAPHLKTAQELENLYYKFPGYREKIKKCGIVAFEL